MRALPRWLLPAVVGLGTGLAAAGDDAREWLLRMDTAISTRNYDGTFIHVHGGQVETLRIIHRANDGEVMERLISLDGSGREFVRSGTELTCYLPDERAVLVEQRPAEGLLMGSLPRFNASTAAHYDMRQLERARLIGRDARVIEVMPRDDFRYGYRLWIDEQTAMPLKTQLCDAQGNVIEQVVFASLALPDHIADNAFKPQMSTEGFRWLRQTPRALTANAAVDSSGPSVLWDTLKMPAGFHITSRASQVMPGSNSPVEHIVLSDGVASVSVFVENRGPPQSEQKLSTTMTQVGSSTAFATERNGLRITAVGEVPGKTVQFIVGQVELSMRAAANESSPAGRSPAGRAPTGNDALWSVATRAEPVKIPDTSAPASALAPRGPRRDPR